MVIKWYLHPTKSEGVITSVDIFNFIMIPSSKLRGNNSKPYESNW